MVSQVLEKLRSLGYRLVIAESCTGGAVSSAITAIPGASDVFNGGIVAYSNKVKERLLSVDPALIEQHGAVSQEVALAMHKGILEAIEGDVAIAVTGIAGPTGGTPDKPVGTVFVAVGTKENPVVWNLKAKGDRETIIRETVLAVYGELDRIFPM